MSPNKKTEITNIFILQSEDSKHIYVDEAKNVFLYKNQMFYLLKLDQESI